MRSMRGGGGGVTGGVEASPNVEAALDAAELRETRAPLQGSLSSGSLPLSTQLSDPAPNRSRLLSTLPVRSPLRQQLVSNPSPARALVSPVPTATASTAAFERARRSASLRERIETTLGASPSLRLGGGQRALGNSASLGSLVTPSQLRESLVRSMLPPILSAAPTRDSLQRPQRALNATDSSASTLTERRAASDPLQPSSPQDAAFTAAAVAALYREDAADLPVYVPVALTLDHRPDRPDEAARVMEVGGRVLGGSSTEGIRDALPRVYGSSGDGPGLAVTRCVGCGVAASVGVIPAPETAMHVLTHEDQFLLLATDGVWAVLSSDEAVAIVGRVLDSVAWGGSSLVMPSTLGHSSKQPPAVVVPPPATVLSECAPRPSAAGLLPEDVSQPAGALRILEALASAQPVESALQRDPCPLPAHPSPSLHGGSNTAELHLCVGATGPAPVAGCGGGGDGLVPLDLVDSLLPQAQREARLLRRRRVALVAAEAVIAAAKAKWVSSTASGGARARRGSSSAAGLARLHPATSNPDPDRDRGVRAPEALAVRRASDAAPDLLQSGDSLDSSEDEPLILLEGANSGANKSRSSEHRTKRPLRRRHSSLSLATLDASAGLSSQASYDKTRDEAALRGLPLGASFDDMAALVVVFSP